MAKAPRNDKAASEENEGPPPRSGRKTLVKLGGDTSRLARGMAGRNGFAVLSVATRWREIAGEALAAHTQPLSVTKTSTGGTLLLRAESGAALLIQHQSREILSRVNAVLGEGAVTAIRLQQGAIQRSRAEPKPVLPRLSPAEEAAIAHQVEAIADAGLRERMASLLRTALAADKKR